MIYYKSLTQEILFSYIINFKQLASCWLRALYIINCCLQVEQISFKDRFSFHCLTLSWTFVNVFFVHLVGELLIFGKIIFLSTVFNCLSPNTTALPSWLIEPSLLQLYKFWISLIMFEAVFLLCAKFFRRVWSVIWHTWHSPEVSGWFLGLELCRAYKFHKIWCFPSNTLQAEVLTCFQERASQVKFVRKNVYGRREKQ